MSPLPPRHLPKTAPLSRRSSSPVKTLIAESLGRTVRVVSSLSIAGADVTSPFSCRSKPSPAPWLVSFARIRISKPLLTGSQSSSSRSSLSPTSIVWCRVRSFAAPARASSNLATTLSNAGPSVGFPASLAHWRNLSI